MAGSPPMRTGCSEPHPSNRKSCAPPKGGNSSSRNNCCSAWGQCGPWSLIVKLHAFLSTLPIATCSVVLQDASYYCCTLLPSLNAKHVGAFRICNWKEAVGESSFLPRSSIMFSSVRPFNLSGSCVFTGPLIGRGKSNSLSWIHVRLI